MREGQRHFLDSAARVDARVRRGHRDFGPEHAALVHAVHPGLRGRQQAGSGHRGHQDPSQFGEAVAVPALTPEKPDEAAHRERGREHSDHDGRRASADCLRQRPLYFGQVGHSERPAGQRAHGGADGDQDDHQDVGDHVQRRIQEIPFAVVLVQGPRQQIRIGLVHRPAAPGNLRRGQQPADSLGVDGVGVCGPGCCGHRGEHCHDGDGQGPAPGPAACHPTTRDRADKAGSSGAVRSESATSSRWSTHHSPAASVMRRAMRSVRVVFPGQATV